MANVSYVRAADARSRFFLFFFFSFSPFLCRSIGSARMLLLSVHVERKDKFVHRYNFLVSCTGIPHVSCRTVNSNTTHTHSQTYRNRLEMWKFNAFSVSAKRNICTHESCSPQTCNEINYKEGQRKQMLCWNQFVCDKYFYIFARVQSLCVHKRNVILFHPRNNLSVKWFHVSLPAAHHSAVQYQMLLIEGFTCLFFSSSHPINHQVQYFIVSSILSFFSLVISSAFIVTSLPSHYM